MTEEQFNMLMADVSSMLKSMEETLTDIAESLRALKEATLIEMRTEIANQEIVNQMRQAKTAKNAGEQYLSGRTPLRDGDTFGMVAAQPVTQTSPEPAVHADHPTGHLRSSDEC